MFIFSHPVLTEVIMRQKEWIFFYLQNFLFFFAFSDPYEKSDCFQPSNDADRLETVHGFKVDGLESSIKYDFNAYKGKVMLIVNVASF